MTKEEIVQYDLKYRYMLLSRMQADCEYYLGYGCRNRKRLWAGDENRQIEYMLWIYDSFTENEKPVWLTREQIMEYAEEMQVSIGEEPVVQTA